MAKENEGNLVTLLDEDGKEQEFEHLASLEHEGSSYVALIPYFENPEDLVDDSGELVILKMTQDDNGEEILSAIENETEFNAVAEKFEEMLADDFDFEDETEDSAPNEDSEF
jgi:uncharacterized protein YrzB (UPF0473 family)